jgi:steroid 5-alpha reductase family enzyme
MGLGALTLTPVLAAAGAVLAVMLVLWARSLVTRDVSVVDVFWAPAFALASFAAWLSVPGTSPRAHLALACVTAWGLRLGVHLGRRARGRGEDRRYAAMRAAHGARFPWVSLGTVFGFQGVLVPLIGLPLLAAVTARDDALGAWDLLGATVFVVGFAIEGLADLQLTRFLASPRAPGTVMDRGLWGWSRHPNYFGDAVLWWGFGLLGVAAGAPLALVGPLGMTFLLLRVSGVALLERDIAERRPAYRAYVESTSAFVPWPPRRRRAMSEP